MDKKAAIELSMNFLVIIVLSLVIFGFSMNFIMNIYGKAKGMQAKTFEDLDRQIGFLRCGTEQVCIGDKSKEIIRGEMGVYGIRILNVFDHSTKFKVFVIPAEVNFETDTNYLDHPIYLLPKEATGTNPSCDSGEARCIIIDPDKSSSFALGVEVNKATKSGTYVFDVYVKYDQSIDNWQPYGETQRYKINVIVP